MTTATSDAGVARTAAANRANRERAAERAAMEFVRRIEHVTDKDLASIAEFLQYVRERRHGLAPLRWGRR